MSPVSDKAKKRDAKKPEVKRSEAKNSEAMKGSKADVERSLRMYRRMLMIRLFEEQVNELYTRALMPGLAHLYVGEEAVAVGICEALRDDD
ncbi:MAG: acetoin:2,6-dichlorophenolindophenol oxidoreductase subunit alpha, partial [Acidobacteriaceae bacterium]|nr:acetoin:2,6-dichlorophenolindophenol oxidoreductase subunit alpha [Acidobacteriaceae bacterium]